MTRLFFIFLALNFYGSAMGKSKPIQCIATIVEPDEVLNSTKGKGRKTNLFIHHTPQTKYYLRSPDFFGNLPQQRFRLDVNSYQPAGLPTTADVGSDLRDFHGNNFFYWLTYNKKENSGAQNKGDGTYNQAFQAKLIVILEKNSESELQRSLINETLNGVGAAYKAIELEDGTIKYVKLLSLSECARAK